MANWKKIPVPPDATIKILKPDAHSTSGANGSSSTWSTTPRKDTVPRSSRDTMTDRCRPPVTWSITRYSISNSISTEGTSRSNERSRRDSLGPARPRLRYRAVSLPCLPKKMRISDCLETKRQANFRGVASPFALARNQSKSRQ